MNQINASHPSSHKNLSSLPTTYFQLIEKLGSKGKYQYILIFIFTLMWFASGVVLLSTAFIFNNPNFDCETFGLLAKDCSIYVCSLPKQEWANFITEQAKQFKTLANQFGDYLCQDQFYLNLYSTAPYFGTLVGTFAMSIIADNFGRRLSMIISGSIFVIGTILLIFSQTLWMASMGLMLGGIGADGVTLIQNSIMSQSFDNDLRQKAYSIIQMAFTIAGLIIVWLYYFFEDWKIVTSILLGAPVVISFLLSIWYIKQTPMYLIKENPENALKELNKIGQMNKHQKECLQMYDIQNVMRCQQTVKYAKPSNPIDVFRYKSLRLITICLGLINMSTFIMYYGPSLIVEEFGFDIYTSSTVLDIADILVSLPLMLIINKIRRRIGGIVMFGIATIISIFLIFFEKPDSCDKCSFLYVQLVLISIFRFVISMEFTLISIYQPQLYPIRVRNISGGVLAVFGSGASTLSPIILGFFSRNNYNPFILFTGLGLLATGCYSLLPQTLNKLCPQQIQEIQYEKMKNSGFLKDDKLRKY